MPIINGQGRVAVRLSGITPAPSSSYLLDTYGGAAAAYSLRKLSTSYSGSAIRVRRSSDNTEQNIGFDGSGNLDTTALTTFVGGGNGFVVTWYDQSGNGKNAVQTTAANQPRIVNSGVVETISSSPAVNMLSLPPMSTLSTTYKNAVIVAKADTLNVINYVIASGSDGLFYHGFYGGVTGLGGFDGSSIRSLTGGDTNRHLGWFQMKSSKLYVAKDGSSETDTGSFATSLNLTEMGGRSAGSNIYFQGKIQEVILYNSDNTSNKSAIESNINTYYSIYSPVDSDAQAFITAAGISDSTQQSAVNTLVTSLKSAGIWSKMKAIYPFVGGTATSHKFNLKDPRDLDAAYRLVFNGGWTHSSTGALPNGTNGYANTYLTPSTNLTNYNAHSSIYSRTNGNNSGFDLGSTIINTWVREFLLTPYRSGQAISGLYDYNGNDQIVVSSNSGIGFFNNTITSQTSQKLYKNGVVIGSNTNNHTSSPPEFPIWLGAVNASNVGGVEWTNRQLAFTSIGDGLTDAEASALYTAVQAFQTTLGRQVA